MGAAYPEFAKQQAAITEVLRVEETSFFETIANGMGILEGAMAKLKKGEALAGDLAFKLHDTFGFPRDLTADMCREADVAFDEAGFDAAMEAQKAMGRAAGKFKMDRALEYTGSGNTFVGYEHLTQTATVLALYFEGASVQQLKAGQEGVVVLDTTPFYAESGGQVGDEGLLFGKDDNVFAVLDTQKIKADVFSHLGNVHSGSITVGDTVEAKVNPIARQHTIRNHSATHLMHKALREVLGTHVQQKGSLVNAYLTRFDFAHNAPVTDAQIVAIEHQVNAEIVANAAATARVMDMDAAKATGAMMLFGEKYGESVRVLNIGSSVELCGGVHVQRTGDIGLFKIISEGGVAAGVRRIEAVTGMHAVAVIQQQAATLDEVAKVVHANSTNLLSKVQALQDAYKASEKELAQAKSKLAANAGAELASKAVEVNGVKVLSAMLDGADSKALRDTVSQLRGSLGNAVIVLASVVDGKVQVAAGVSDALTTRFKAGELVNFVAQQVGGKGGGKADTAMAGGTDAAALPGALASVAGWVSK
jgi:alanyl-tRNA synthetase